MLHLITCLLALCSDVGGAAQADTPSSAPDGRPIHIAVLYREGTTGQQHWQGAREAWEAAPNHAEFHLYPVPYDDEGKGLRTLLDLRRKGWQGQPIDLVLGPTDSGVFIDARAWELQEQIETRTEITVPVISSLVVATVPQNQDSWFFRTNVDVERRANAIHDVLGKRLVNSATVLYEDTEFGMRAEQAFKKEFALGAPAANYHSIPFASDEEARSAAREVLKTRPECVGIFARRPIVASVCQHLRDQKTDLLSYEPLLFSVLDLRVILEKLPDIYFVSVTRPEPAAGEPVEGDAPGAVAEAPGDTRALSYDTTAIVLAAAGTRDGWSPTRFRTAFASVLQGGTSTPGSKTGMDFADYTNTSSPLVYHHQGAGQLEYLYAGDELSPLEQLSFKSGLVLRRYGYKPALILLFLVGASMFLNFRDIRRWFGGSTLKILLNRWFLVFAVFNVAVVLGLYVYLSESGYIHYDSFTSALLIVLAPAGFMKTNWFENGEGTSIGPRAAYNKVLAWINSQITVDMYQDRARQEHVLVWFNSLPFLETRLRELYAKDRPPEKSELLLQQLVLGLEQAETKERKLRFCASRLLTRLSWKDLIAIGCVPPRYEDPESAEDPLSDLEAIVKRMLDNRIGSDDVDQYIRKRLLTAASHLVSVYESKLGEADNERGRLFKQLRFLILQFGMRVPDFEDLDAFKAELAGARPSDLQDAQDGQDPDATLLGQLLIRGGPVSEGQLKASLDEQPQRGGKIGSLLVERGACSEQDVTRALRSQAASRAGAL